MKIEVANRVMNGDKRAENELYAFLWDVMYQTAMYYIHDAALAETILQESIEKVFIKLPTIRISSVGALASFSKTLIRNRCIDEVRNKWKKSRNDNTLSMSEVFIMSAESGGGDCNDRRVSLEGVLDLHSNEFTMYDPNEVWSKIYAAADTLSPAYQKIFKLYYFEEYTHKEIAEELGICVGASKSNLHKAKANMRTALASYHDILDEKPEFDMRDI